MIIVIVLREATNSLIRIYGVADVCFVIYSYSMELVTRELALVGLCSLIRK